MLPNLEPEEKLHLSRCVYEESTLKLAGVRAAIENPRIAQVNGDRPQALWIYARSAEHWENVSLIREEMGDHVQDHPYIPALDRIKTLCANLEGAKERLQTIAKKDHVTFIRMSAEIRNLVSALREEAKLFAGVDDSATANPVVAQLKEMQKGAELREKLEKLGVLTENPS